MNIETQDIDFEKLTNSATQASTLLKSLAHPDRLLLLCQLVEESKCVSDLETATGIKQPSLSQQLGILRKQGLVDTKREGRNIFYTIDSPEALAVMQVLYEQFCTPNMSSDIDI